MRRTQHPTEIALYQSLVMEPHGARSTTASAFDVGGTNDR
jgi:hypothetical protein